LRVHGEIPSSGVVRGFGGSTGVRWAGDLRVAPSDVSRVMTPALSSMALRFTPRYQQRVWGGRAFEALLGRDIPEGISVGESWEAVDRGETQSVLDNVCDGRISLHTLWTERQAEIFGSGWARSERFPLLLKLLDARESLSVQVHPSATECARGFGEPKTEWWHVLDAAPDAAVFAGLRPGVTRPMVEDALHTGEFEPLLHRIPVRAGDSLFVPAGRIHAIGAGCLIAEVQQNSDTTYRVFDWNRAGSDGLPRELHIKQSLECINFEDHAPSLAADLREQSFRCDFFSIEGIHLSETFEAGALAGAFFLVAQGSVRVGMDEFRRGDFFLLPARATRVRFSPHDDKTLLLRITAPSGTMGG
jgi:mannose-6-phosphate isomerase